MRTVHLGYEVGTGDPVEIPLRHLAVTGQTQESGKTTTLEALVARAGVKAVAFLTKRGEGSFRDARVIAPYFREQADWQFVASILEASRGEKLRFERAWIIRAAKGARTLADVQTNVRRLMDSAKGLSADVYLTLDAYLDAVVPQIGEVRWAPTVDLAPGLNAMDLTALTVEMQHLVIRSTIDWVLHHATQTVVVVPEAWKFIPQGRGTPVKLAAEAYIRQAAGLGNYLWLDSQDIAGVEKIILKSVPVWILGVQREANEIKRTLAQIPAGIKRPSASAIATLGLGQFFLCYGTHTTKVYVQPAWMGDDEARAVARGREMPRPAPAPINNPEGETVNEREAAELRQENEALRRQVQQLLQELDTLRAARPTPAVPAIADGPSTSLTEEGYQALKRRFIEDLRQEPAILRVLAAKPELAVEVQRQVVEASGDTLRGRLALLIAEGYFDEGRTGNAAYQELQRRGFPTAKPNVYREADKLAALGFLTKEESGYRAVPGMKVNIIER